ncbi:winged helix domain-containing protein [Chthonobacter albigriseus]|uniref:winged helix domain-containing protein n=1 Tax=Chthonobacter albigriseus TaxID=1683161 RepID=UPI00188948CF|nr:hypothetical protein [Chthonobacter albigriseus]
MSKSLLEPSLSSNPVVRVVAIVGEGEAASTRTYRGRFANTLAMLVDAGATGITAFDNPGPRLSHYVMKLRQSGLAITTEDVKHGGPFPGHHGRYRLASAVRIVEAERA